MFYANVYLNVCVRYQICVREPNNHSMYTRCSIQYCLINVYTASGYNLICYRAVFITLPNSGQFLFAKPSRFDLNQKRKRTAFDDTRILEVLFPF